MTEQELLARAAEVENELVNIENSFLSSDALTCWACKNHPDMICFSEEYEMLKKELHEIDKALAIIRDAQ